MENINISGKHEDRNATDLGYSCNNSFCFLAIFSIYTHEGFGKTNETSNVFPPTETTTRAPPSCMGWVGNGNNEAL